VFILVYLTPGLSWANSSELAVTRSYIDVRTFGALSSADKTVRSGLDAPDAQSLQQLHPSLIARVTLAVFHVVFSDELFVNKSNQICSLSNRSADCTVMWEGVTRLICGTRLFESHPPTSSLEDRKHVLPGQDMPLYLVPWQQAASIPMAQLFAPAL